ncbi:hypothetical protein EB796_018207 [Bugula neritina]|uniref:TRIM71 n=1 Tax=Bugula neritina TaxID=10212 RepID=A0A7J7JBM6_BUGNE|nr:hypothetical protein EB796_018207 [Bugula neritina]
MAACLIGTNNHLKLSTLEELKTLHSLLVTGFAQVNTTHAFIVDNQKHCIRVINRENNQLRDFAGTCGTSGYAEGRPGEGRFHKPWGIIADVRDPDRLLVADKSNHAIRSVNLISGEVGTVRITDFTFLKVCNGKAQYSW